MIDTRSIQESLARKGFYQARIDGEAGRATRDAIDAALAVAPIDPAWRRWGTARRLIAFQQLMMREVGIDSGSVDGLVGPQTRFAFDSYDHWQRTGALPPPWRDQPGTVVAELPPRAMAWPQQSDVPTFYGTMGVNQARLSLPYEMKLAWNNQPIRTISVHQKVHDSAKRVFDRIADAYDDAARRRLGIHLFGGSLNVRLMRGGTSYSMHSWGIAIDFDPERNQLRWGRDQARLAQPDGETFWKLWEEEGWVSLGRTQNYDWMHVQAARP